VYAAFNIPRQQAAFDARMERARLDNVIVAADLSAVPDGCVGAWVIIRNMHDFYIPSVVEAAQLADGGLVMREVLRTLAPGGTLGVVDSRTTAVAGIDPDTHRINPAKVIADLEAHGFEYVDSSELLADPGDDHRAANFPQRWDIDRFLLKFRKPR